MIFNRLRSKAGLGLEPQVNLDEELKLELESRANPKAKL